VTESVVVPFTDGNSTYQTDCMQCNRPMSLWMNSENIHSIDCCVSAILLGSVRIWCSCGKDFVYNPKIGIGRKLLIPNQLFDSCGCLGGALTVSYIPTEGVNESVQAVHVSEDRVRPKYRPGYPLPQNGACKHHKKTFRWIQYENCCKNWFPCNACHKKFCDIESNSDNDNDDVKPLMMCGFCAKEQSFSNTCISCHKPVAPPDPQRNDGRGRVSRRKRR
jgi:hypothetical protein